MKRYSLPRRLAIISTIRTSRKDQPTEAFRAKLDSQGTTLLGRTYRELENAYDNLDAIECLTEPCSVCVHLPFVHVSIDGRRGPPVSGWREQPQPSALANSPRFIPTSRCIKLSELSKHSSRLGRISGHRTTWRITSVSTAVFIIQLVRSTESCGC